MVRNWFELARNDRLIAHEIAELTVLGDSLHDTGQIKPVTGQVVSENGHDVFRMLTGERRFGQPQSKLCLKIRSLSRTCWH